MTDTAADDETTFRDKIQHIFGDKEVKKMGFKKHGVGEILPDAGDVTKTANKAGFDQDDEDELAAENDAADKEV
jgi:hypothetical protein